MVVHAAEDYAASGRKMAFATTPSWNACVRLSIRHEILVVEDLSGKELP